MTETTTTSSAGPRLRGPALVVAVLAVALWGAFVVILALVADTANEVLWARYGFLLASVEAVAFAAAGALFGASIQRERAEKAEERAEQNASEAMNGKAFASAVYHDAPLGAVVDAEGDNGEDRFGADPGEMMDPTAIKHARMAKSFFPNL